MPRLAGRVASRARRRAAPETTEIANDMGYGIGGILILILVVLVIVYLARRV